MPDVPDIFPDPLGLVLAGGMSFSAFRSTPGTDLTFTGNVLQITQSFHRITLTGAETLDTIDVSKMPTFWGGLLFIFIQGAHAITTTTAGNISSAAKVYDGTAAPILLMGYYDAGEGKWLLIKSA